MCRPENDTRTCAEDHCSAPVCDASRELCSLHHLRYLADNGRYTEMYDLASDEGISPIYVDDVIAASVKYTARVLRNSLAANTVLATIAKAS